MSESAENNDVEYIGLLEIGAHAYKVKTLTDEGTAVAWAGVANQTRVILSTLSNMNINVGRSLRVFLWKDGIIGEEELVIKPENYAIYEYLHDEYLLWPTLRVLSAI